MAWPSDVDHLTGALYIVTHPKEYDHAEWRQAMVSCLLGEHGDMANRMVRAMAEHVGIIIPDEYD